MKISEKFDQLFNDCDKVRTAVYGIGQTAKDIIHTFPFLNIVGFYDRDLKYGTIYGKKILDISNIKEDKIERIIIAATAESTRIIYNRISCICIENNIALVNVNNDNLYEYYTRINKKDCDYFHLREQDLISAIENHDVISFDIFDTLIMRTTLFPHDIFELVERRAREKGINICDFCKYRIQAEQNLIAQIPNIYELYDELQKLANISDEIKMKLLEMELQAEHNSLLCREVICNILQYAHRIGKKVYLVSDMYIPKEILNNWLYEFGITDYDDIFISCEFHTPKVNGLYHIYRSNVVGDSFLHIGDNEIYDGEYPKKEGIDVFVIKSALDMFRISSMNTLENYAKTYGDRILLGMCLAKIFHNPFALYETEGCIKFTCLEEMSYIVLSPAISAFVLWLIQEIKGSDYDGMILAARDGYLIEKLISEYEKYTHNKLIPTIYMLTSRIACVASDIHDFQDFHQVVRRSSDKDLVECMQERLDIIIDAKLDENQVFEKYYKEIIEVSDILKKRYLKYMQKIGVDINKKYAFFDFVSSGTSYNILKRISGLKLVGKFFYRYNAESANNDLDIDSFFTEKEGRKFWECYMLFETVVTAPFSTFLRFDKDEKPIYEKEKRSTEELELIKKMQQEIVEYFKKILEMQIDKNISKELIIGFSKLYIEKQISITDEIKQNLFLYDSYEGGKISVL